MNATKNFCLILAAVMVLALAGGCSPETPAFQVNDLVSDPAAFSGPLTVVGITYGYSKNDPTIIGIMDKKELQCTTPGCNKVLLPVKVQGAQPAIGAELRISGAFSRESGGYLFRADKVEVLNQHNLGGQG